MWYEPPCSRGNETHPEWNSERFMSERKEDNYRYSSEPHTLSYNYGKCIKSLTKPCRFNMKCAKASNNVLAYEPFCIECTESYSRRDNAEKFRPKDTKPSDY